MSRIITYSLQSGQSSKRFRDGYVRYVYIMSKWYMETLGVLALILRGWVKVYEKGGKEKKEEGEGLRNKERKREKKI